MAGEKTFRGAFTRLGRDQAELARFFIGVFGVCGALVFVNTLVVIYQSGLNKSLCWLLVASVALFILAGALEWKRARLEAASPERLHFLVGVTFVASWVFGLIIGLFMYL